MDKSDLAEFAERIHRVTARLMRLVPEDKLDWRPSETGEWFTVRELLGHLPNATGYLMRGLIKGQWCTEDEDFRSIASVAQALERLEASRTLTAQLLTELPEEVFRNRMICGPRPDEPDQPYPLRRSLHHCVLHQMYHHATLFTYLKLMGINVNTDTLYAEE